MPTTLVETEVFSATVVGPATGDARTSASVRNMGSPLANRTTWLLARIAEFFGIALAIESANPTTDAITITGHGKSNNDPVRVVSVGGTVPGGLTAGAVYYVRDATADTFAVAATAGGAAIDLTSAGTGSLYAYTVPDALSALFSPAVGDLPAGSIRGQITWIVSNFAKLGVANIWTNTNTFQQPVTFSALTLFNQTLQVASGQFIQLDGILQQTGSGGRHIRRRSPLADSSQTIDVSFDVYVCATPAANRVLTLRSTTSPTPFLGETILVVRPNTGAFTIDIQREGGTSICTLNASSWAAAVVMWNGSAWGLIDYAGGVTLNNPNP